MPISTETIVRVAHADVEMGMAFPRSIRHWHRQDEKHVSWKTFHGDCGALLIGKGDSVIIEGNCSNGVSAPDGGVIHIHGNLTSKIEVGGHNEIIITGDVDRDASIEASRFCDVFVGGRFCGEFRSTGSTKVWMKSDFTGTIRTGHPSTTLHIGGDYSGDVTPLNEAALLFLTVKGFAPHASLTRIADCNYTQFNGSIGRSDVAPGLYPLTGARKGSPGNTSFNRWCVEKDSRT